MSCSRARQSWSARPHTAAAVYAVEAGYHIVYLLAGYQAAYSLEVAVAAAQECYLLDYIVITGHYVYH